MDLITRAFTRWGSKGNDRYVNLHPYIKAQYFEAYKDDFQRDRMRWREPYMGLVRTLTERYY